MPENATRDLEGLYDHERDAPLRRRTADDWGIDEDFPRVRGRRFARDGRASEGPARRRRRPVEDWGADEAFDGASRQPEPEPAPPALTLVPPAEESIAAEIVDTAEPRELVSDG